MLLNVNLNIETNTYTVLQNNLMMLQPQISMHFAGMDQNKRVVGPTLCIHPPSVHPIKI